jgi:hypothetical protein
MAEGRNLTRIDANCYEVELAEGECKALGLDSASVLLELRPHSSLYGVFYTAKGMQWDVWSDSAEDESQQDISFAIGDPARAAYVLLSNRWRPDFQYDSEENAE